MTSNNFWDATTKELKQGYKPTKIGYQCILCNATFAKGQIYEISQILHSAKAAAKAHVATTHPNLFDTYLNMGKVYNGLSPSHAQVAKLSHAGKTDKEIMEATGAGSISTIRNQRFQIREKYKQAKILVALVELMEAGVASDLVDIHPTATCIDSRYAITQAEKAQVLKRYFAEGKLVIKNFPTKEKKKIIILQKLMENFDPSRSYTEPEMNEILGNFYEDVATVRRYLIEYGFFGRNKAGESYQALGV